MELIYKDIRIRTIFIYTYINNRPSNGIFQTVVNNHFGSCFLINVDVLLSHTVHIDKNIFSFFAFTTFEILLPVFYYLKQYYIVVLYLNNH